ncbi:hypothetical protein ACFV80_02940 [Streptomyces sp. NPDC059862]|uniref:hypothetical protein n=1 Tax=Streptomyces sp. NPDC059862 TaxID=3346975 RepID=UPI0036573FFE
MILLLGADPHDAAIAAFAEYLTTHAIPHVVQCDLGRLGFGLDLEGSGRTRARLHVPGHGTLHGEEVAVFVRRPRAFAQTGGNSADARFAAREYYAALWSLCASLPKVINQPGPQAWPDDCEVRRSLERSVTLPEYWTTDPGRLLERWGASASPEVHVEDLLTRECRIVTDSSDLRSGRLDPTSTHLRAVFAPSSRYVVHVCVGQRSFTVLNESGVDVDAEPHRTLLRDLADALRRRGIRFFAVALVTDDRQRLAVSRILPDPPFAWYREHADAVHERLCAELAHPFQVDLEATGEHPHHRITA